MKNTNIWLRNFFIIVGIVVIVFGFAFEYGKGKAKENTDWQIEAVEKGLGEWHLDANDQLQFEFIDCIELECCSPQVDAVDIEELLLAYKCLEDKKAESRY